MDLYLFIVIILGILAITDLVVGVSNDAVNFLNSAIGSKVASFKTILWIAIAGVMLGSLFSSGIMEIARTGIFYPQKFTLEKLLYVFLAVMLTDIVLLDIFNTLGLPTSTTVSIVFELIGASLMAGVMFSMEKQESSNSIFTYVNTSSVGMIIAGIFLSILIAFSLGIIVQYVCRLVFSFEYEQNMKKWGSIFGGFGVTSIIYFLLIKGLKGTNFLNEKISNLIDDNIFLILALVLIFSITILFILKKFSVDPLRVVVLLGTFSLAMAFAGNDLVNFIGVPITGLLAFQHTISIGENPSTYYQTFLTQEDIIVPNYLLLLAGCIMGLTLWFSTKAKGVTDTEVNLSSHDEGDEKFRANMISRSIVKTSILISKTLKVFLPENMVKAYNISFEKSRLKKELNKHDQAAFDLLRASINLILASSIIAFATSKKLPLSTTYVSFMVAMGTSLADKAWGRSSAVYRVAGVLSVIGGWLITAIIACSMAALFTIILIKGEIWGISVLLTLVIIYLIYSQKYFSNRNKIKKSITSRLEKINKRDIDIIKAHKETVIVQLKEILFTYRSTINALYDYDEIILKNDANRAEELSEMTRKLHNESIKQIKSIETTEINSVQLILLSTDFLDDLVDVLNRVTKSCTLYVQNLHEPLDDEFKFGLKDIELNMFDFFNLFIQILDTNKFEDVSILKSKKDKLKNTLRTLLNKRVKLIQSKKPSTKTALLETTILLQSRDMTAILGRIFNLYKKYLLISK